MARREKRKNSRSCWGISREQTAPDLVSTVLRLIIAARLLDAAFSRVLLNSRSVELRKREMPQT